MAEVEEEEQRSPQAAESDGDYPKLVKTKDFFDVEANASRTHNRKDADWGTILKLAFQCIGVVYGDLGTSPLYVLPSIFPNGIKEKNDVLGVLSLIIYSLIIITLIKYVFIVLAANDNGDGGTFALYSLICRHSKASLIPNQQAEDRKVSTYKLDMPNRRVKLASAVKSKLESNHAIKYFMLFMTMLGVSMVLGDGILTPCISVLSAVGGIKEAVPTLSQDVIMWVSVVILVFLFQLQRFGTDKVGYTFAPIIMLWFFSIATIGLYNFIKYDPSVIKAVNPYYIIQYFQRNGKDAWISLGGVVLCLTGSEALFADLGHFNVRSVRLSSCTILIPSVLLAYVGQCSYLQENAADITDSFFKSIPKALFWPQFIVAVLAAIIASQSLISASFSIIQQSVALGCFPRIKVVHTSADFEGQVYIPEINTFLMIACVAVTLGFKNTIQIGNAYGIAVTFVFVITSALLVLIMIMIWKINIIYVVIYILTIGLSELIYLSATLYKFVDGGYLPLLLAFVIVTIMFIWSYGYRKKYLYELENKISVERLTDIVSGKRINRIQGLGLFYSQLVQGVSPVFTHYISSIPALHSVLVFVSIKSLPISKVPAEERFLFQRVKPGELIFRCIVRYGYTDSFKKQGSFEQDLANQLKEFIRDEQGDNVDNEIESVDKALNDGIVYLMGEAEVMAANGSSWIKKFTVDYLYNWLSRCVRQPDEIFLIPRKHLLKVGMTYDV
ncbi:potassium transporter 5-like [Mercurialis annua]|uniref:potassium transporter 5-like n=1 Tax=Mercurialis annua TaxID=3986 RepID=UPI00215E042D|nr:potassium transporter 5-like [Mercurialis annua]